MHTCRVAKDLASSALRHKSRSKVTTHFRIPGLTPASGEGMIWGDWHLVMTHYEDLDLLFVRTDAGYRIKVIESPAGEADALLLWSPGEDATPVLEQLGPNTAKELGKALFDAIFNGETLTCLRRSLDEVQRKGTGLRVRLRLADVPELASWPWEFLYDPAFDRFLALSSETPLVRYLDLPQIARPLLVEPPLKVLVMISSPSNYPSLDAEGEWHMLDGALERLRHQGCGEVARLGTPSLAALRQELSQNEYHVLHFVGHGAFDTRAQDGVLILETEQGEGHPVRRQEFGTLLHDHRSLRLVFLEACHGAAASRSDPFAGTAQGLVRQGVPAVVAMQFAVTERAAMTLVGEFYSVLAGGSPVDASLAEARKAVSTLGRTVEWATPVLFSRLRDNRLIAPASEPAELEIQWFEPETVYVPAGPFLMGSPASTEIPARETPQYSVDLPAYRIGTYPVTNEQYAEFVRQTGRIVRPEAGWDGQTPPADKLDHPVSGVTWYDTLAYCGWLSKQTGRRYGLPSEAQWEKAARGTDGRLYPWGDEWDPDRCNYGGDRTAPVGAHPGGKSPYGCYDMVGNVRQWTSTLWGRRMMAPDREYLYPWMNDGRRDDLQAPSQIWRVYRASAYNDPPDVMRCSTRGACDPQMPGPRGRRHGFRVELQLQEK